MQPNVLILRAAGVNCDGETAHAFERAGATAEAVHINRLMERPALLEQFQLMAIPGGFSYGDDIAAGRILSHQLNHHLGDALARFVERGKPIIGICNGFQVLIRTRLLPGWTGDGGQPCTLTANATARFVDRWVHLRKRSPRCVWTALLHRDDLLELPIAHGEGRFLPADEQVRQRLWQSGHVALTYAHAAGPDANAQEPANPNGSTDDIAGICDSSGLVLGLMPHPERHIDAQQHPAWSRQPAGGEGRAQCREGAGLAVFRSGVAHAAAAVGTGV